VCIACVLYMLYASQKAGRGAGAYGVSKTALFGLTKALSVELGTDNIRVNCLAPGLIKTSFSSLVSNVIYLYDHPFMSNGSDF